MERKNFLKKGFGFLGMSVLGPALLGASRAAACVKANSETEGPYPTHTPTSWVRSDIVGTRTGIPLTVNITVKNVNNACSPAEGIIVDIWHCDKDGNYSEYGSFTTESFLRGRQTTDSAGLVSFTTIFPGWYTGRATHIHVHVYTASGTSLVITQIAFPEGSGSAVETVNAAASSGYTKGMSGYTYNATDGVFSDGTSTEMSTISGSVASGYVLDWDCYVEAPTTGIEKVSTAQFQMRQNFPNPCSTLTKIPLSLAAASSVRVVVSSLDGKVLLTQVLGNLNIGEHTLDLDVSGLAAGNYIYTLRVENLSGTFKQSKLFIKQ